MSWKDSIKPEKKSWKDTIQKSSPMDYVETPDNPKPFQYGPVVPIPETLARSFGAGATLDNSDELIAALRSAFGDGDWERYIKDERRKQAESDEANPLANIIGRTAGYAVPGTIAAKIAKPVSILGRAGVDAALGAGQGFGSSEKAEDIAPSMLEGAGINAGIGALGDKFGPMIKRGAGKSVDIFNKIFMQLDPEVSSALRANPKILDDVMTTPEIAESFVEGLNKLRGKVTRGSKNAMQTLQPVPLNSKQAISDELDSLPAQFNISKSTEQYPETQATLNEIQRAREAINASNSHSDIKSIISVLDQRADFATPNSSQINAVKKKIRGIIDRHLKTENPEYAAAMKPLARNTKLLSRGKDFSGLEQGEGGFLPTDKTTQAFETLMGTLNNQKRGKAKKTVESVAPGTIENLTKQRLFRKSEGGVQAGSRNAVTFGALGAGGGEVLNFALGGAVPPGGSAVLGALVGAAVDKYGRTVGSAIARNTGRAGKFISKYGSMFKPGIDQELTHSILMGTDPDYGAMFKEIADDTGFNNPGQAVNFLGSAVLGDGVTKIAASAGAGIGSMTAGGDFRDGFNDRVKSFEENPLPPGQATAAGIISNVLPTGKLGRFGKAVVSGVQNLDELLSPTGKMKNSVDKLNVRLPDGSDFPSRVKNTKTVEKKLDGLDVGKDSSLRVSVVKDNRVEGYITHPDFKDHTTFTYTKDHEGTWTLDSNFRKDFYANTPELMGSSARMRKEVARVLGGIASSRHDQNSDIGIGAYIKDPNAIALRSNTQREFGEPHSKFFTPGSKSQKKRLEEAIINSYGTKPEKEDFLSSKDTYKEDEKAAYDRRQEKKELAEETGRRLMNNPEFEPKHTEARSRNDIFLQEFKTALQTGTDVEVRRARSKLDPAFNSMASEIKILGEQNRLSKTEAIRNEIVREERPLRNKKVLNLSEARARRRDDERVANARKTLDGKIEINKDSIETEARIYVNRSLEPGTFYNERDFNKIIGDVDTAISVSREELKVALERGSYGDMEYYTTEVNRQMTRKLSLQKAMEMLSKKGK